MMAGGTAEYQSWQPLLAKNEMANPSVSYVLNKLRDFQSTRLLSSKLFRNREFEWKPWGWR